MPSQSKAGFDVNPQNINRKGRPKKALTMTSILNSVLAEEQVTYKGRTISGKEAVSRKMLELALQGDFAALKYCYDRLDGTPVQSIRTVETDEVPETEEDPEARKAHIAEMIARLKHESGTSDTGTV